VKIFGLRGIQTAPAYLESTSLVFAWGVDMFFTRVTPSGAFDMLNEVRLLLLSFLFLFEKKSSQ
jgi:hypothetical protein